MVDNPEKMETILFQTLVFDKEDEANNSHKK